MYIYDTVFDVELWKKNIHAYASIWRCLMHDIIIEIREKAFVHAHHLEISTQEWKWKQLSAIIQRVYERWRGGRGGGGGGASAPRSQQYVKKSNKMEASSFRCFFFWGQFIFYSLLIQPCYLFSRESRYVYFSFKPNQIIKWSGLKRIYNLCIYKKAKFEINGSHR